jgi:hypothetical protein
MLVRRSQKLPAHPISLRSEHSAIAKAAFLYHLQGEVASKPSEKPPTVL